jgi:tRNA threonylcarbamoyladenosine biosynthesis protein TsaB
MTNQNIILALDSSMGGCSVALLKSGQLIASKATDENSGQSRLLIPMIEEVLQNSNLTYQDCDHIACSVGPGSFTGIRVALTAARSIALILNKKLLGLSNLEIIASSSNLSGDILSVINAYRGQFYAQRFNKTTELIPISEPILIDEEMLTPPLLNIISHGAKLVETKITAIEVAILAYNKLQSGQKDFLELPLYIREPDAKLPA